MYSFPQPPQFLLMAGLFISLVCGLTFATMLRQSEKKWLKEHSHQIPVQALSEGEIFRNMEKIQLSLPFIGTCIGACIFFASALDIFGIPTWMAYVICLPITIAIGFFLWFEIGSIIGKRMLRVFLQESAELFRGT